MRSALPYCHGFESRQALLAVGDEIWVSGMKELLPIWTDKITWAPVEEVQEIRCAGAGEKGIIGMVSGCEVAFDQCIVQSTAIARDNLADHLGCQRNEKGQLEIDDNGHTSAERVYSAGDQTPAGGQVNIAVAAGHKAAIAINEALVSGAPCDEQPRPSLEKSRKKLDSSIECCITHLVR